MVDWAFAILIISYCLFIVYLWMGWERISVCQNEDNIPSVAVIIPVRNEVVNIKHLLQDMCNQTYQGKLEVLVINDHSEDGTKKLVEEFIKDKMNFRLISLKNFHGKKTGLTEGVARANAELILTIDGDCRAPKTWIEVMVQSFQERTQFVSGPVAFLKKEELFSQMQSIEFASLIGSGAALIGWGKPVMANGANMGFRRNAFLNVNGFEGNEQTASGDDVFLLHKIAKEYSDSITFVKHKGAVVCTKAKSGLHSFIQQRIRWASKWKAYNDRFTKTTAVLVFMLSLSLIAFPFVVKLHTSSLFLWANLLVIKAFFDFFFIRQVAKFSGDRIHLFAFVLLQLVYPFYVVFTGLFSLQKSYEWKGRKVK